MIPNLDGSHAIVGGLVAVAFWLSRTLYVAVQQRRYQNGHERRRPITAAAADEAAIAWRATISEQMATIIRRVDATREDIHDIRDNALHPLSLRLALVEKEVEHIKRERA